jgi:hypothetical protein
MERPHPPKLVGVIHLAPLPGSPHATNTAEAVAAGAAEDARVLLAAGYDAIIVENFGDIPFLRQVEPITVSAMTLAVARVRDACPTIELGVNVLRNDAQAALAVAVVAGASFIRVNVHVGARVTDQGVVEGEAGATLRTRRALDAQHVSLWADVDVKHSAPLGARPIKDEAKDATLRGLADVVLITGEGTGRPTDLAKLAEVRSVVTVPVYVASGAVIEQLSALAHVCDGVVVGSALRRDGKAGGRVDPDSAAAFARAFRGAYAS